MGTGHLRPACRPRYTPEPSSHSPPPIPATSPATSVHQSHSSYCRLGPPPSGHPAPPSASRLERSPVHPTHSRSPSGTHRTLPNSRASLADCEVPTDPPTTPTPGSKTLPPPNFGDPRAPVLHVQFVLSRSCWPSSALRSVEAAERGGLGNSPRGPRGAGTLITGHTEWVDRRAAHVMCTHTDKGQTHSQAHMHTRGCTQTLF